MKINWSIVIFLLLQISIKLLNLLRLGRKQFSSFFSLLFSIIQLLKPWLQGFGVKINILPPLNNNESIPDFIAAPVGTLFWRKFLVFNI